MTYLFPGSLPSPRRGLLVVVHDLAGLGPAEALRETYGVYLTSR